MCQPAQGSTHVAQCVYSMALGQCYLACRAMIDGDPDPEAQEMADRILTFTREAGIYDTYEPAEVRLLQAPFGSLPRRERVALSWAVEGVAVMAWALGKAALPPFDTRTQGAPIGCALGLFQHGSPEFLQEAKLRSPADIQMCALSYTVLSWRLAQYLQHREKVDFAARLREPDGPHMIVDGINLQGGDLAVDGMPLDQIEEDRLVEVCSIVRERHKAFRWLLGYDKSYAAVTTVH
jgi:hypothetical protein